MIDGTKDATITSESVKLGDTRPSQPDIAVLIPCYQEELTIAGVVEQFRAALPAARIYVFDNNSSDRTVPEALSAGATVLHEKRQGKGYVVQSMFRKIDADIYVMVDGDGTYPASVVGTLIEPIRRGEADMVIGSRLHRGSHSQFRFLNRLGNRVFLVVVNSLFGVRLTDLLSGYRVFSADLVRSMALFGGGFETETELTIKVLERGLSIVEVPVDLSARPAGSHSKIRLAKDGAWILRTTMALFRDYRPLTCFGGLGLFLLASSLLPGAWVFVDYYRSGYVHRIPSAVLAVGLVVTGVLSLYAGFILHTIARRFRELELQLRNVGEDVRRERRAARTTRVPSDHSTG
jgi:glycosyltransferase involved in cell wall biosynthesis